MLTRLNGIFAFALWDARKRELFLARDGMGVKPLYYAALSCGFMFASEIKALVREKRLRRDIDADALRSYLTYLWCPAPRTMIRDVKKLEPGHALIVHGGAVMRKWCFYTLPLVSASSAIDSHEATETTRKLLAQAVERQMVADVPVGAFLSGGLDSSSIVHFARQYAPANRVDCFAIGFTGGQWAQEGFAEDLPYARQAAKHLGVDLHEIQVGPELWQQLETMLYHLDEPQADPAPLNVLAWHQGFALRGRGR